jgi:excisionase family DNA binding protein
MKFLTLQDAAEFCGLEVQTIRRYIKNGLPFVQVAGRGGKILISKTKLERFLQSHERVR